MPRTFTGLWTSLLFIFSPCSAVFIGILWNLYTAQFTMSQKYNVKQKSHLYIYWALLMPKGRTIGNLWATYIWRIWIMEGRFDTHNNKGRYYTKFRSSLNREVHHTSDVSDVGLDNYHDVRKKHKQACWWLVRVPRGIVRWGICLADQWKRDNDDDHHKKRDPWCRWWS